MIHLLVLKNKYNSMVESKAVLALLRYNFYEFLGIYDTIIHSRAEGKIETTGFYLFWEFHSFEGKEILRWKLQNIYTK